MNCTECKEKLIELLEGLLPETQSKTVQEHLKGCQHCRQEFQELKELSERLASDAKTWQQTDLEDEVFNRVIRRQHEKLKQADRTNRQFRIWRRIMHSKITKYATAAIILFAVVLSINFLDRSVTPAYAIEQTLEAYNRICFLHVKQFKINQEEPLEYWIKSDEQGNIINARYYLPEHVSPEDGAKLITWNREKAELWFNRKNSYLIFQSRRIEDWVQSLIEQSQPKLVMKKLLESQEAGTVSIDIQEPSEKQKPVTVAVVYKTKPKKEIYYINQATDLITYIEYYHTEKDQDVLDSTTEFYDYNVPIDDKMFSIKDEIPDDVTVVDWLNQLIGIPQGDMTEEQAAVETVRQFFQSLIDKDYQKAGLIFSGVSEEKIKEYFGHLNVTRIISVGPATPYPKCGPNSFSVTCETELITVDGQQRIRKFGSVKARCGDDEMHPDRWIIHGGI